MEHLTGNIQWGNYYLFRRWSYTICHTPSPFSEHLGRRMLVYRWQPLGLKLFHKLCEVRFTLEFKVCVFVCRISSTSPSKTCLTDTCFLVSLKVRPHEVYIYNIYTLHYILLYCNLYAIYTYLTYHEGFQQSLSSILLFL